MRKAPARALAAIALALPLACPARSADDPPAGPPRLVLLYAPCTVNRDHLAPYAPAVTYTPHLARFARQAVVFERHTSEAGHSGTAYASIFTGTQAPDHRVFVHPTPLPGAVTTVAEAFAAAGYETFFWGGQSMASARYDYGQGVPPRNRFGRGLRAGHPAFAAILRRLAGDPGYRAFVVTHFTVTHSRYKTSHLSAFCRAHRPSCRVPGWAAPDLVRFVRIYAERTRAMQYDFQDEILRLRLAPPEVGALVRTVDLLYRANVHRLDALFGDVLDAIERSGLLEQSLIAFTADHGERLYRERGLFHWTHGWELAPEVLTVPWLLRAPGLPPGHRRYAAVTRSTDVFPTLAALAGLAPPAPGGDPLRGVDLSPALAGRAPPPDLPAFSHTVVKTGRGAREKREIAHWARYHATGDAGDMWVALREGDRALHYRNRGDGDWGFQAFDLAADPYAETDRFDAADPQDAERAQRLTAYRQRLRSSWEEEAAAPIEDAEALEALRELGYAQ